MTDNEFARDYWTHEGDCGVPFLHVHYGRSVVIEVDEHGRPILPDSAEPNDLIRGER